MTDYWLNTGTPEISMSFGATILIKPAHSIIINTLHLSRKKLYDVGHGDMSVDVVGPGSIAVSDKFGNSYVYRVFDARRSEDESLRKYSATEFLCFLEYHMPSANESTNDEGVEFTDEANLGELDSDDEGDIGNGTFSVLIVYPDGSKVKVDDVIGVDLGETGHVFVTETASFRPKPNYVGFWELHE